jgi:hypothetical protein
MLPNSALPGIAPGIVPSSVPQPPGTHPEMFPQVGMPGMVPYPASLPGLPTPPTIPNPPPPGVNAPAQPPLFVSNPFIRSPRDFFMWNEVVEDQAKRFPLPKFVP